MELADAVLKNQCAFLTAIQLIVFFVFSVNNDQGEGSVVEKCKRAATRMNEHGTWKKIQGQWVHSMTDLCGRLEQRLQNVDIEHADRMHQDQNASSTDEEGPDQEPVEFMAAKLSSSDSDD